VAATGLVAIGASVPGASASPARPTAPAAAAKDPIVIVSGLTSPEITHALLKARFAADGYNATIFELPGGGLGDIADTSAALAPVVDRALAAGGTGKVDLIGHSEGGIVARYYMNRLGGAANVDTFISLAGPHYGTYAGNIADFFGIDAFCEACEQMAIGSDFLNALNAGPDVVGGVHATTFRTLYDIAVRPVDNAKLQDGAENILVQAQCPLKFTGHSDFAFDGAAYDGMRDAIRHEPVHMNCWAL
jgi:triacylglycerol esterase/lipase EstA (alpha/beta hydrolase family)